MPLPSESQTPISPDLFRNFQECKTARQRRVIRTIRLRQLALRPLFFLWRMIK